MTLYILYINDSKAKEGGTPPHPYFRRLVDEHRQKIVDIY